MKHATFPVWPPIIGIDRAPWFVRLRDTLLTILVWALLLYLLRDGILLIIDYFSDPIFKLTRTHTVNWRELWDRFYVFLVLSAVTMLWLMLWSLFQRRRLQLADRAAPRVPLSLERHAAIFNFTVADLERWRTLKVAVVQFDGNHRVSSVNAAGAGRSQSDDATTLGSAPAAAPEN